MTNEPTTGLRLVAGKDKIMGQSTFREQVYRALTAIDCRGESKHRAKQEQGWKPGQPVHGVFSEGTYNTVFDRAMTFANGLKDIYPASNAFGTWMKKSLPSLWLRKPNSVNRILSRRYYPRYVNYRRLVRDGLGSRVDCSGGIGGNICLRATRMGPSSQ